MEDESNKSNVPSILNTIFRLAFVYIAATSFFQGVQDWQDEQYLQSITYFSLTIAEIILIFQWNKPKSKLTYRLMWSLIVLAFIFLGLSKIF